MIISIIVIISVMIYRDINFLVSPIPIVTIVTVNENWPGTVDSESMSFEISNHVYVMFYCYLP